jgi:hypothetical protein
MDFGKTVGVLGGHIGAIGDAVNAGNTRILVLRDAAVPDVLAD